MILVENASINAAGEPVWIRLNTDSGSNYYNFGLQLYPTSTYSAAIFDHYGGGATSIIHFATLSQNAGSQVSGYVLLSGCNSAGVKVFNAVGAATANTSNEQTSSVTGGYYNSSSTISSISVIAGGGTFDAGTVFVYTSA